VAEALLSEERRGRNAGLETPGEKHRGSSQERGRRGGNVGPEASSVEAGTPGGRGGQRRGRSFERGGAGDGGRGLPGAGRDGQIRGRLGLWRWRLGGSGGGSHHETVT
jgi:hypothetical protein